MLGYQIVSFYPVYIFVYLPLFIFLPTESSVKDIVVLKSTLGRLHSPFLLSLCLYGRDFHRGQKACWPPGVSNPGKGRVGAREHQCFCLARFKLHDATYWMVLGRDASCHGQCSHVRLVLVLMRTVKYLGVLAPQRWIQAPCNAAEWGGGFLSGSTLDVPHLGVCCLWQCLKMLLVISGNVVNSLCGSLH